MKYKLYLYDSSESDYKGIDYSDYLLQGVEINFNLDDTLHTAELTLFGLDFEEEFAPKTKFILEMYDIDDDGNELFYEDYHFEVSNDAVNRPIISDETYFSHHLSLIEPIVEAQGRLVDNIAITYKLKDVNLEVPTTYNEEIPVVKTEKSVNNVSSDNYGEFSGFVEWRTRRVGHQFLWTMPDWYTVNIDGVDILPSAFDWDALKYYQITATSTKTVEFPVPMLEVKSSIQGTKTFQHNGYATIDAIVQKTNRTTGVITSDIYVVNYDSDDTNENWVSDSMRPELNDGWVESRPFAVPGVIGASTPYITSRVSKVSESVSGKVNRKITIIAENDCSYSITFRLHEFSPTNTELDNCGFDKPTVFNYDEFYDNKPYYFGYANYTSYVFFFTTTNEPAYATNTRYPVYDFSFVCTQEEDNFKIFLKSAPPQNALNLFQKATLTTQDNTKQSGVKALETDTTFYLENNDYQELQNTTVVENFYNQKNLFEIYMEVGKNIHARPYARFGENNKYLVRWKRYGLTDQFESTSQPVSIFNSRFVEEYISSVSSYVNNMVQLGGTITETIAPKSSSEDLLVYNDVAQLILSKPIIELVELIAINSSGVEVDITDKLYEKGVYKLLPIQRTALPQIHYSDIASFPATGVINVIYIADDTGFYYAWNSATLSYDIFDINAYAEVSKGMALYYSLGDNKIQGLNYRLPSINTGDNENEYAIKRILGKAYSISGISSIKVNDYTFRITYRTKDSLRTNQTRPDLRKYLLASDFDKFPQHSQFNNQEDTLVDSVKFGNNTYGKLIRTGNTVYTYNEFCDALTQLKKEGQLYNINGNLYYVSKVTNTYFAEHILTQVEFSKDFNRLSQIIGIPSEPRFYQISEQSLINREKTFDSFLVLGTSSKNTSLNGSFVRDNGLQYVADLILDNEKYPQYAVTYFKNDIDTTDPTYPNRETFSVDVCHPVSTYSLRNTLTMEWDMEDNFSAGNAVNETTKAVNTNGDTLNKLVTSSGDYVLYDGESTTDTAYNTLEPVQYCDANGRADLVDFAIIKEFEPTREQTFAMPYNPIDIETENTNGTYLFGNQEPNSFGGNDSGEILLKDNREVPKLNKNLQLLTDSDRFVISGYMWQQNKTNIKLGLLKEEVNKISNDTVPNTSFSVENIAFTYSISDNAIIIDIATALSGVDLTGIKAIVIYSTNEVDINGAKYFIFARNITGLSESEAKTNWVISNYNKNIFEKQ